MPKTMKKILSLAVALAALIACSTSLCAITRLDVGTYNLRNSHNSDAKHGNGWSTRVGVIAQLIQFHDFDIFGTQECYIEQLQDLKALLPAYDYIGVARDDGKTEGEHSAIFFRTDKFELLKKGDFWLNEHPDTPELGWDAACVRICSWGMFRCKDTGFEFMFFNLHMDHVGKTARVKSAGLVVQKIKQLSGGRPTIVTGDFNVDQTHPSYAEIVNSGILVDSYEAADAPYALNGTFNGFHPDNFSTSRIDHVFVSPKFKVAKYGILTDTYRSEVTNAEATTEANAPQEITFRRFEARTPSDHFPVKVVLYCE